MPQPWRHRQLVLDGASTRSGLGDKANPFFILGNVFEGATAALSSADLPKIVPTAQFHKLPTTHHILCQLNN